MKKPDILVATEPVTSAFNELGVPYYIGGSVASSAYGIARSTLDVDIVSRLKLNHVRSFVEMLEVDYYIDENMIVNAIKRCSTFNIIHLNTMIKIDIFIPKNTAYIEETFKRRKKDTLDEDQKFPTFYLVSPEDIVLNKLLWFRLGGEVSERQWHDILGVLKVQWDILDKAYLFQWAPKLNVDDLLLKAFDDAE